MIEFEYLEQSYEARLWIDESIKFSMKTVGSNETTLKVPNKCDPPWETLRLVFEMRLPRNASNYVLLGLRYYPANDGKLVVRVDFSEYEGEILEDNISLQPDEVHIGIPKEYVPRILKAINEMVEEADLPCGKLIFDIGAHALAGSSPMSFYKATKIILKLMQKDPKAISTEELADFVYQQLRLP